MKSAFSYLMLSLLMLVTTGLAQNNTTYLDEEAWAFLNNSNSLFEQAFADASQGVTLVGAQQYVSSLTQLFGAIAALEQSLRQRQSSMQQLGRAVPTDLSYLVTAIASLGSGISALVDFYQQAQSPTSVPGVLQNNLRIAQLNSTIYFLSLALYNEKAE